MATVSATAALMPAPPAKSPLSAAARPPRSSACSALRRLRFSGSSSAVASERRARKISVSTAAWLRSHPGADLAVGEPLPLAQEDRLALPVRNAAERVGEADQLDRRALGRGDRLLQEGDVLDALEPAAAARTSAGARSRRSARSAGARRSRPAAGCRGRGSGRRSDTSSGARPRPPRASAGGGGSSRRSSRSAPGRAARRSPTPPRPGRGDSLRGRRPLPTLWRICERSASGAQVLGRPGVCAGNDRSQQSDFSEV